MIALLFCYLSTYCENELLKSFMTFYLFMSIFFYLDAHVTDREFLYAAEFN